VIAEDERNDARIITPASQGGWGVDGMWSDDFHHTTRVALTHQREAHFVNYSGALAEWLETLRHGWYFHGQYFRSWKRERGTPVGDLPPEKFVLCISNHDQVGNRPLGDRVSEVIAPEAYRALSMLLCLSPYTPLLFMGQEWATASPFPYFTDLPGEVGANMAEHRRQEFLRHGAVYSEELLARMPDPQSENTFRSAKLDWNEREHPAHRCVLALYRECLRLRASHLIFQSPPRFRWTVEKVRDAAIALHWTEPANGEWLLIASVVNAASLEPSDPAGWDLVVSSNDARFGGERGRELTAPGATLWRKVK
jgi:maltooligosyltrehalose trehalohydrolase